MKRPLTLVASLVLALLAATVGSIVVAKHDLRSHPVNAWVGHVYHGDPYVLRECGPGTYWYCPSYPANELPEDAPLWWCDTDGNEVCGDVPITRHAGVTCITYDDGSVCQWPDGYRKAL